MSTTKRVLMVTFADEWLVKLKRLLSCDAKDHDYEWAIHVCEASRNVHIRTWTAPLPRERVKVEVLPLFGEAKEMLSRLATIDTEHKSSIQTIRGNIDNRLRNLENNYLNSKPSALALDEKREAEAQEMLKKLSNEKVILDTVQKKLDDLRIQIYKQMEQMVHTLNISKVNSLSNKLHKTEKKLKEMYHIISQDPDKTQSYHKKVISLLNAGRKDLQKMHDVLDKGGVFELIDTLAKERKLLSKESVFQDSIPISEKAFIKNLGFNENESRFVYSFYQSSLWGRKPSLSGILGKYINVLEKYVSDYYTGEQQQDKIIVVWIVSACSVLGGASLVGWNVGGYVLTCGVVVSPDSAVQSCIEGTTLIVGGVATMITKREKRGSKQKKNSSKTT